MLKRDAARLARTRRRAAGFRDVLPGAAEQRRQLSDAFLDTFSLWGYGLISTPIVESLDTIAAGVDSEELDRLFRFMDADGRMLALVGERTVSVARVVATELRDGPFPLRLCYSGPVLRNQPLLGGRRREALQAGCELIGSDHLGADAECIALAADAVRAAGIANVQIDIGHAAFLPGLIAGAGLDDVASGAIHDALTARDLVAVENALDGTPMEQAERSLVLRFPALRGGREILDVARAGVVAPGALQALDQLSDLWELLVAHDVADAVHIDLGAVRDWHYYTGPTFELFSGDVGFPIGSGGRYDGLFRHFGIDLSATGFVLLIDRCQDTLGEVTPGSQTNGYERVSSNGSVAGAIATAREQRSRGVRAVWNFDA